MSGKRSAWRRARAFLSEALRDNEADFTTGPISRGLGLLAIPMMLEMAMESIFAVVDIAFVSRLGTDAVAAVGITEALITVLYAVAIGLGMGVTAMVSRRIGAKDAQGAAEVAGQSIWVGVFLSIGIGILGVTYARDLLALMGAFESHPTLAFLATLGVIFAAYYMLPMVQTVFFNKLEADEHREIDDLSGREMAILAPLCALMIVIGWNPTPVLERMEPSVRAVIERVEDAGARAAALDGISPPRQGDVSVGVAEATSGEDLETATDMNDGSAPAIADGDE